MKKTFIVKHKKKLIVLAILPVLIVSSIIIYDYIKTQQKRAKNIAFLEYFHYLDESVTGFTYFNLNTIKQYYNESVIRAMYLLDEDFDLADAVAVILSSKGTFIIYNNKTAFNENSGTFVNSSDNSLYTKIHPRFHELFGGDRRCDVLGYLNDSVTAIQGDTYLSVSIEDGIGDGIAILEEPPSTDKYELLEVVGVFFKGMEPKSDYYSVHFTNYIATHIGSGIINNFTSTQNCVNFFLYGGNLNQMLESSLRRKIRLFSSISANEGIDFVYNDIEARDLITAPIIIINTSSGSSQRAGNVAPYGIVLRALKDYNKNTTKLEYFLEITQHDGLWPFDNGSMSTSLDSTLVFDGLFNASAINITKVFMKNSGGFLAQLNDTGSPYSMTSTPERRFWCQEDYGTTAACYYFLDTINEANQTTVSYLINNYERRSSMWLANPYYIDYLTARALINQSGTEDLCENLTITLLSQCSSDGTWGSYDIELSTAFAILALELLNYTGYEVDYARLKLTQMQNSDGSWNSSTLYYWATFENQTSTGPENLYIDGNYFEVFLCEDIDPIITTSFILLALENNTQLYGETKNYEVSGPLYPTLEDYLYYVVALYEIY